MDDTRKIRNGTRALVASSLVLALAGASLAQTQSPPAPLPSAPPVAGPANPVAVPQTPVVGEMQRLSDGFAQVAEAVLPAVVSIRVEGTRDEPEVAMPIPFPFGGGRGGGGDIVRGTGSGVVLRSDGIIVTNNHVVENADRIDVHLRDGRVLRAQVLGTDPSTDLAVIRVNATGLPTARWADSDAARVGEWVLAIGAPFGLEASVTHGVLSAKGRAGLGANAIEDYLQTDASINPGNSGGPLVNLRGEVMGINTMILGRGTGVGFAVPSRIARLVAEQISTSGGVSRGWIGVGVQDLAAPLAEALRVPTRSGAIVSQVDSAGPAGRAGLRIGDVVTRINERPVQSSHDVVRNVTDCRPGDRIELTVLRDGRTSRLAVTAGTRPDDHREGRNSRRQSPRPAAQQRPTTLGLEVSPIDPMRARQFGANRAVVVTAVEPDSAAERAGLRRGDVILRADNHDVAGSGDLAEAMQDGRAAFLVRRRNQQIFVPVQTD